MFVLERALEQPGRSSGPPELPLALPGAVTRTFDTPGFAGITFYEIQAKSIINRVPGASRMPFEWTINPYRGCTHACVYCFARNTHTYLDLDAGHDFDTKIVVKVNAARAAAPRAGRAALGGRAHRDGHQRRLLPAGRGPLPADAAASSRALRDFANPFSILTKGTLILRDLDLLRQAAEVTSVGRRASRSASSTSELWRDGRAGHAQPAAAAGRRAPPHRRRLRACGVLMAPILPGLTDTAESIEATVRGDRGRRRRLGHPAGAAPAPRRPRVVHGLAGPAPSGAGAALPRALQPGRVRAGRRTSARSPHGSDGRPAGRDRRLASRARPDHSGARRRSDRPANPGDGAAATG